MLSSPRKASQTGSALLIVLVIALVALASIVGLTTFRKSAIPSSPASYQAQIVSATPTPSPIPPPPFVQSNSTVPGNNLSTLSTSYTDAQTQGNLNVIIIGWQGTAASIKSVSDTQGNT